MCTKTTAHTKKHYSHPSSLWACVSAEDDWYYDCCAVGSVWGMFLWHQRPLSVLLHVSRLKGKGGWNPGKRLGVFVIRGLPGNLNTFTFLGSEEQWLVRLIWKQSFLWTPYNLKGNGCFFFLFVLPLRRIWQDVRGGWLCPKNEPLAGWKEKTSSQNMDPHPMIRSLCLSWLTIKNTVKSIDCHIL